MIKKIDELNTSSKDVNSPESQEFLRKLQERMKARQANAEELLRQWQEEDRHNAGK